MRLLASKGSSLFLSIAALLVCSFAAGQTAAAKTQEKTQAGDCQKPGESPVQTVPPEDLQLLRIDQLDMDPSKRLSVLQTKGSQPIHEVINPFTARKRARIYGSLYEYHRNDNFDARNFFDPVGRRLPEYKRNQFGSSFGVSVTERLKLFGAYDGLRINRGSTILSHVPTPEMKRGDFSSIKAPLRNPFTGELFINNQIPRSLFHPVSVKMLATIPDPNRADPDRNFVNNQPYIENRDKVSARVDLEFSEDSKIFGNYTLIRGNGFEVASLPLFGLTDREKEQDFSIEYVRDFSPQLVASVRASFSREADTELSLQAGNKGLVASLGIAGLSTLDDLDEGYPDFDVSGYASLGSGDSPKASFHNEVGVDVNLTYVWENHVIEVGSEIEAEQINNDRTGGMRRGSFEFAGDYAGDAFADFLLGIPNAAERGVGSDRVDVRRTRVRAFMTDEWKVNRKLSLSGGLAYKYVPFSNSIHDDVYAFVPLRFEPPVHGKIVRTGSEEAARLGLGGLRSGHAVYPDRDDWEPRLGFAYSPQGNNRLVIRVSYRLTHDARDMDESFEVLGRSYPVYYTEKAASPEDRPALDLSNPFESAAPAELKIEGVEPHMRNSYEQEWQLTLQNEIFPKWNVEIGYLGRKRTRSDRTIVANVPTPGPGVLQSRRPNPNFGRFSILDSGGSSSTNSLVVNLRKRLSRGFSIEASYQWNRTFGSAGSGDPSNPRDLGAERAPSSSPLHTVNLSYIFDVPVGRGQAISAGWAGKLGRLLEGWRISGIASLQTGNLFNPRLAGDPNNDGVWGDRPDRLGSGELPKSRRSIDRWFATEAFVYPLQYSFGNCGRNILVGPGKRKWDISFIKRTQVSRDGDVFELRVQLFNAFNHANFSNPNATVGTSVFGKIFGADRAREIEIAVKYTF